MDSSLLIVGRERDAAAAVREILGPRRSDRLADERGYDLVQALDSQLLDGVEARVPSAHRIIEAERLRAHLFRIAEKIVDHEECRDHKLLHRHARGIRLGADRFRQQWRMQGRRRSLYSRA